MACKYDLHYKSYIQFQEVVRKMVQEELQNFRVEKGSYYKCIPKTRAIEDKTKELLEREANISCRERNLEGDVEYRAQNLFRELRDNFFENKIINPKNSVLSVLEIFLSKVIFAEIKEPSARCLITSKRKLKLIMQKLTK